MFFTFANLSLCNCSIDDRTYHEALLVEKGLKYGANAWLHLRNFKDDDCPYEEFEEIVGNRRQHYGENTDDEE